MSNHFDLQSRLNTAFAEINKNNLTIAESICNEILNNAPNNPDAMHFLGLINHRKGDTKQAIEQIKESINRCPDNQSFHLNLGVVYRSFGKPNEALNHFQQVLNSKNENTNLDQVCIHIGDTYKELNELNQTEKYYLKALNINKNNVSVKIKLGILYFEQGQNQSAIKYFKLHLKLFSNDHIAHNYLGILYQDSDNHELAIEHFQKAISSNPQFADSYSNYGNSLHYLGKLHSSIDYYNKSLKLDPSLSYVHINYANSLLSLRKYDEAIKHYRKGLDNKGNIELAICNLLLCLNYLHDIDEEDIYKEHVNLTKLYKKANRVTGYSKLSNSNNIINIGYVSSDFKAHPVSYFMESILKNHDRNCVKVYLYSNAPNEDDFTKNIKSLCDVWRNIYKKNNEDVKKIIQDDKIQILIDLNGHTGGSRLSLFALKPAPIQISYLGYPNTTGLNEVDYRITDNIADPKGNNPDRFYTEKLIRMNNCFLCYTPPGKSPAVNVLPALNNNMITFGSFNNFRKLSPHIISLWCEILKNTDNSRLVLKCFLIRTLDEYNEITKDFQNHNIDPDRIIILNSEKTYYDHLKHYNNIDISLDTYPYNGTTTTVESLWMGVPVITLSGNTHRSRVGNSILTNIGKSDYVAHSEEEYINKAIKLSNDTEKLSSIRDNLRETIRKSNLTNASEFTRELEQNYRNVREQLITS